MASEGRSISLETSAHLQIDLWTADAVVLYEWLMTVDLDDARAIVSRDMGRS